MKTARITGVREGGVIDVPDPRIAANFVKIKVEVTPMCTEYKAYKDGRETQHLGHEFAGEVIEIAQPGKVKVGDRVTTMPIPSCGECVHCVSGDWIHCQNMVDVKQVCGTETGTATYSEFVICQDWLLTKIPDGVSYEHGSLACCGLGPTFGAMHFMKVNSFHTVLITGMGPVGLGGVVNGSYRGAKVIAVESHPYRKNLAKELGAYAVLDPSTGGVVDQVMELTGGNGADFSIDCSGSADAQRNLIDATRRRGTVSFVGEAGDLTIHVSNDLIRKGLNLHGAWHWNRTAQADMIQMISEVGDKLDKHITHTFPLDKVTDAWELQMTGNCGKVLLHP